MRSSGSAKTLGGFGVMQLYAKSAKESAKRVAEENGIKSGSGTKLWETVKAKVHGLSSQVQESFAEKKATSTRRSSGATREKSSATPTKSGVSAVDEELVRHICELDLFNSRASEVAVRLALSKSKGADKAQNIQIACDWLLDEKNVEEIEAAEDAEIERISAAQELPAAALLGETPSEETLSVAPTEQKRRFSGQKRRLSGATDDGRGLGFFMSRRSLSSPCHPSEPSPRKVPMPGRLSRGRVSTGSADSGVEDSRPSLARRVSIGSQTSAGSEGQPLMTPRSTHPESDDELLAESEEVAELGQVATATCGTSPQQEPEAIEQQDEADQKESEDEEEESEEEAFAPNVQPPNSACWDWPLSRNEKKARFDLIEKQMSAIDRQSMKEELQGLRTHLRKMSVGGGRKESRNPSRLST